uniref:Uncharacterized protein n=1 Tax=Chromera velia CCMP2878 TaxID=1169474 RepID=A0A0G4FG89_9ALVE|eukprot:Cvel_16864.t1-p1 / transcript=Cvel_16864.t1 / gene=Cvel_16864 / organism=Chromera_velia_CCMP2878 / gene_product=hypothetical protein / transcript_product=hypothetical protein / location=Cvel_scaffold1319:12841-15275(-) / protein_length=220 / sequence_SO=supercontig / SO=protein_coding / is_pseudo=false
MNKASILQMPAYHADGTGRDTYVAASAPVPWRPVSVTFRAYGQSAPPDNNGILTEILTARSYRHPINALYRTPVEAYTAYGGWPVRNFSVSPGLGKGGGGKGNSKAAIKERESGGGELQTRSHSPRQASPPPFSFRTSDENAVTSPPRPAGRAKYLQTSPVERARRSTFLLLPRIAPDAADPNEPVPNGGLDFSRTKGARVTNRYQNPHVAANTGAFTHR